MEDFGKHIYGLTAGHAGLVGICCNELVCITERDGKLDFKFWSLYAATVLPARLSQMDTYNRILFDVNELNNDALQLLEKVGAS